MHQSYVLRLRAYRIQFILLLIIFKAGLDVWSTGEISDPVFHGKAKSDLGEEIKLPLSLPSMNETGGAIFFYHMQKTGGVTIRKAIWRQDRSKIHFARLSPEPESFLICSDVLHQYLLRKNTNSTRIQFFEHHGGNESVFDMLPHFEKWRNASKSTGIPLFIFTLLREPVSHAISHFNFFHVAPGTPPYDHILYEPTETNLKSLATSEHQLRMLAHGGEGRSMLDVTFDDEWEQKTLQVLHDHFSWIGTTEQLSQVTLPLLSWLVLGNPNKMKIRPKNVAVHRWNVKQLSIQNMTVETLSYLESINHRVKRLWNQGVFF